MRTVATTDSGSTYEFYGDGRVLVRRKDGSEKDYFNSALLRVSKEGATRAPWSPVEDQWEDALVPVVGRHMYLWCPSHWLLSTKVVSVEEREADDG